MRTTAPWLISLLLHSVILIGMVILTRVPPELPRQLALDFQITPQTVATVEEPAPSAVEPPTVEKTPVPAEKIPARAKKPPPSIEELSPPPLPETKVSVPPPPAPELQEAEPSEIIEAIIPQQGTVEDTLPVAAPMMVAQTAVATERQMMLPAKDKSGRETAAETVTSETNTINHVRGQLLGQLEYPAIARNRGWCGKTVLGFVLCADGSVENLVVLKSSGHSILDRAALQAVVKTAPFSGGYTRTEVRLPINFQLD